LKLEFRAGSAARIRSPSRAPPPAALEFGGCGWHIICSMHLVENLPNFLVSGHSGQRIRDRVLQIDFSAARSRLFNSHSAMEVT